MADEIVLTIRYTEQDFVDAAEYTWAAKSTYAGFGWLLISALTIFGWWYGFCPLELALAVPIGLGFCLFVFFPLATNYFTRRDCINREEVKDGFEVSFSEEGVVASSSHIAGKNYWSVFTGATETPEAFLLFFGNNVYFIVPKRAFTDPQQPAQFEQLVLSKIPNFRHYQRKGLSLARVSKPVRTLAISVAILVAGCFLAALFVQAVSYKPQSLPSEDAQDTERARN